MPVALVSNDAVVSVIEAYVTAKFVLLTTVLPPKAQMDKTRSQIPGVTQQKSWLADCVTYGLTLIHERADVYPGGRLQRIVIDPASHFHITGVSGGGFTRTEIWGRHSPAPEHGGSTFFQIDLHKSILPCAEHPQGKFTAHWRLYARENRASSDTILAGGCRYEIVLAVREDHNT